MPSDKRQFTRMTVQIPATLALYQIDTFRRGSLANISAGGCFFPAGEDLPVGEPCRVTLTVGEGINSENITMAAVIVRSNASGAGIEFVEQSPAERARLDKLIDGYLQVTPGQAG